MFCREQVAQLRDNLKAIRARGAELVVVGNGRPDQAADFRAEQQLTFPLFVDPELHAYAAAGLKRSIMSAISPRVFGHALRAFRAGKRQSWTQGDPWQQGGVFIIRPDGKVPFAYVSEEAGDHANLTDILAALKS